MFRFISLAARHHKRYTNTAWAAAALTLGFGTAVASTCQVSVFAAETTPEGTTSTTSSPPHFAQVGQKQQEDDNLGTEKVLNVDCDDEAHLVNWSRTHEARPKRLYQPDSVKQLADLVHYAHENGRKLRPCGTYLSPNGIATGSDMMVSLAGIDRIKDINLEKKEVTVEAGITVDQLLKELSKLGLTLANFSSIKEQQMGGWTQVAAHGTGATLPTVDEMITNMKILTPGKGELELSNEKDPTLFKLARVGLGCLGIVTELTLSCIPIHKLYEQQYVVNNMEEVRQQHTDLLQNYRHVRYMWIPGKDDCVVVISNPISKEQEQEMSELRGETNEGSGNDGSDGSDGSDNDVSTTTRTKKDPTKHLRTLLLEVKPNMHISENASFSQLRDELLAYSPLDKEWVLRVNHVEAQFWREASGERIEWSDDILGFDCGGSQWVFEMCLPTGTLQEPNGSDLNFIEELKQQLESAGLPAPAPIEQRWTASSSSPMSPAYSENKDDIFSWVGGIMYMPNDENRQDVTNKFREYMKIMNKLGDRYDAHAHWAKIELPYEDDTNYFLNLMKMKRRLKEKYPVHAFNQARKVLDPKNILSNEMMDTLFSSENL